VSKATRPEPVISRYAHYRSFFLPDRRDVLGFRIVAL
jgi:hypothetical protein